MLQWVFRKRDRDEYESEKLARLETAENDLHDLQARGARAKEYLSDRKRRNHWRESVEQLIQGGIL